MPSFDTIIKDGMLIDGGRMPRYQADVGIRNGRIAAIGRLDASDGREVIDAEGKIVAPGFVDLHTHYDAQLFWDPYCTISSYHGVTSVVIGNCGFGFAPVRPKERERAMMTMTRVEAIPYPSMEAGLPWDWTTFPEFLDSIDRRAKGINILPYVPVAPLLSWVIGTDEAKRRKPTKAEEAEICRLLDEAMDAGGCGWSAQRLPPDGPACVQRDYDGSPMVTDVMHDETCEALARVLARRNEGFVQMTLVSGDPKRDSLHYERLAEISGRPILYNVVTTNDRYPERHRQTIEWLERCRNKGLRVYGQAVTTTAGMTFSFVDWNLFDDSAAWCEATTGTREERIAKLSDPKRRLALKNDMPRLITNEFDQIFIVTVEKDDLKGYENLTIAEACEKSGKHPADLMLDLAVEDGLKTEFFAPAVNRRTDLMKELVGYEWTIPGVSDGGAHTKFFCGGRYPTEFITEIVRKNEMLTLEDAHWRLSALPAWCAGFKNRGMIREGYSADVVIYDYDKLAVRPMEVARDLPGGEWRRVQKADGYERVIVNGRTAMKNGEPTGTMAGRLLRHGSARGETIAGK